MVIKQLWYSLYSLSTLPSSNTQDLNVFLYVVNTKKACTNLKDQDKENMINLVVIMHCLKILDLSVK